MNRFEGLLFCTDLDGTLFNNTHTVSQENLDAIEYFKSEGGLFTFITGRVPQTTGAIYELVKPNAPFGCLNGGGIYDGARGEFLWKLFLPETVAELLRETERQMPEIGIQLNAESGIYFSSDNPAMERFRHVTNTPHAVCHFEEFKEPILKIVFGHHEEAKITALAKLLQEHPLASEFDFIRSEQTLYEILPKGASKGGLLCKLAELLSISGLNTIAVGDYNNDVSMLQAAGLGFAVANAVPEAKAAADHITVSNNEHAIATIVEGLTNGTYRKPNSKIIV